MKSGLVGLGIYALFRVLVVYCFLKSLWEVGPINVAAHWPESVWPKMPQGRDFLVSFQQHFGGCQNNCKKGVARQNVGKS